MEFDKAKYKGWTWKHPVMIHWIINPGLIIVEFLLGQRVPKLMLIEKNSNKTLAEKTIIPCPHCQTLHSGLTWSPQNKTAFKNWFGLYCPSCGNVIPCLMNIGTFLFLLLTAPLWYFFGKKLKERWLLMQAKRYQNLNLEAPQNPFAGNGWIKHGLSWGLLMFFLLVIVNPILFGESLSIKTIGIGFVVWTIGGLLFGFSMNLFLNGGKKK